MNIAAVVILYNPDGEVYNRILSYAGFVKKIYLYDNSENTSSSNNVLKSLPQSKVFQLFQDGINKGISVRLNEAAELAMNDGFDWLLTMDQDSYFAENDMPQYFACIQSTGLLLQTAMFGVQYSNKNIEKNNCSYRYATHELITSGSILNLAILKKIGGFDEALFIDKVDQEYCFKALTQGYKIIQFNHIYLNHTLGNTIQGRSLLTLRQTNRVVHSPVRMYYMVRNYFYLKAKFQNAFPADFDLMKKEMLNRIKNNFLYGQNKLQLVKFILKGYRDYCSGKMGKLN